MMTNGEWIGVLFIIGPLGVMLWGLCIMLLYMLYKDFIR